MTAACPDEPPFDLSQLNYEWHLAWPWRIPQQLEELAEVHEWDAEHVHRLHAIACDVLEHVQRLRGDVRSEADVRACWVSVAEFTRSIFYLCTNCNCGPLRDAHRDWFRTYWTNLLRACAFFARPSD